MNGSVGLRPRLLLSALAPLLLIIPPSAAAQRREPLQMHAWIGIAGGLLVGAPIRLKAEKVNTQGIAAAYSGPLIFSRFGLDVEKTFIPHQVALEQMRKGEMAAVVSITSKPLEAFVRGRWEPGFKFLPVPYESKFEDYYLPAALDATNYPNLIKQGERVTTIAVPTALVMERKMVQPNAGDEPLLVSRVVETKVVEQKQILEPGREKVDVLADRLAPIQRLEESVQGEAAQALLSAPAWERKQPLGYLEHGQEWGKAEGCVLNSPLREELDAVRSAAEKQRQALDQERDRADALARELSSLWAERDTARIVGLEAVQAAEAEQALEQERGRADALARELASLRAELDAAQTVDPEVARAAAAEVEQKHSLKQALEQERGRADALARELTSLRAELDAARVAGPEVAQAAAAAVEHQQATDRELQQQRDKTEALARTLASVQAERDMARNAASTGENAPAAAAEQMQATERELGQQRDRAEALARDLASTQAERDRIRAAASEAVKATTAAAEQKQAAERALEQQRDKARALVRDLASIQAERDRMRAAASEAAKVTAAAAEQKQAAERALEQQRDTADALARELTSLRASFDAAGRATTETLRISEAATIEHKRAFEKERDRTEALNRELASARKQVEERSARLAAAHAEILRVTETARETAAEQELIFASARTRSDVLEGELASVRDQLDTASRQVAASNSCRAAPSCEAVAVSLHNPSSRITEGKGRSPEQTSVQAAVSNSERSSASELPPAEPSTARETVGPLDPKVTVVSERSTPAGAAPRSPVDEPRLLARANAFLQQADISSARTLLEHALERGSARAAFMLAETYDAHVLQSWRARGISGDPAKARELYERAQAGGIEGAKERITQLK